MRRVFLVLFTLIKTHISDRLKCDILADRILRGQIIMIQISDTAAGKLKSLKAEDNKSADHFLRVEVKKGGCSGLSYKMDFDNKPRAGDKVFESQGEKLVVDSESFLYLIGMTLDYSGGLNGKGFIFNNPNASKNCGCGASFNV